MLSIIIPRVIDMCNQNLEKYLFNMSANLTFKNDKHGCFLTDIQIYTLNT